MVSKGGGAVVVVSKGGGGRGAAGVVSKGGYGYGYGAGGLSPGPALGGGGLLVVLGYPWVEYCIAGSCVVSVTVGDVATTLVKGVALLALRGDTTATQQTMQTGIAMAIKMTPKIPPTMPPTPLLPKKIVKMSARENWLNN